jgi:tRNA threonylcarbamoyladenosine biosynthesis protein TsaE
MAESERSLTTHSAAQTTALGERLGRELEAGLVIALTGELGSGKTTFVQGLARGLGVAGPVTSPTFALMNEYEGRLKLYHLDAWMAERGRAFLESGAVELLEAGAVCVVEWADRVAEWLPLPHLALELVHRGPQDRSIRWRIQGDAPARGPWRDLEAVLCAWAPLGEQNERGR